MTAIEWTDETWNPVVGCTRVSAGCDHCYAVPMSHRLASMGQKKYSGLTVLNPRGERHLSGVVRTVPEALQIPLRWRQPRRVFVNSMGDLFHKAVPFDFIDRVFAVMALTPRHTYQILTKRPERMAEYLNTPGRDGLIWADAAELDHRLTDPEAKRPYAERRVNVWLGTSVENQAAADERIPHLIRCPAAVRFLSCEPLLGPVNLSAKCPPYFQPHIRADRIGWVIAGGESGPPARPCDVSWIRSIVQQCRAAGVPVFVKQLGRRILIPNDSFDDWPNDGDGLIHGCEGEGWTYQGELCEVKTVNPKGGDPAEWPEDLRVREWPEQMAGGGT